MSLRHNLRQGPCGYLTHLCQSALQLDAKFGGMPYHSKVAEADVAVLVRRRVVAVEIERAVILVLVVVTADVQHNAVGVVVAIVVQNIAPDYW